MRPQKRDDLATLVGSNVRTFRERSQLSQPALAKAIAGYLGRELPKQVVSKIELGRRSLSSEELVAVALALEVPVTKLLSGNPQLNDERKVELSDEWTMTIGELREAVMGDARAAAAMEVRQALIHELTIHDASHGHIASTVSIQTPRVRTTRGRDAKPEPKRTKRTRRGGSE